MTIEQLDNKVNSIDDKIKELRIEKEKYIKFAAQKSYQERCSNYLGKCYKDNKGSYYKVIDVVMGNRYRCVVLWFEKEPNMTYITYKGASYYENDFVETVEENNVFMIKSIMIKELEDMEEVSKEEFEDNYNKACNALLNLDYYIQKERLRIMGEDGDI